MRCEQFLYVGLAAISNFFLPGVTAQDTSKGPCQVLAEYQSSIIAQSQWPHTGDIQFIELDAEMAYNCSISVPLVPDDALETINYLKNYSNFDTTLSFLKKPPPSYQKPGVDVMGRLDQVADNIRNGKYKNQREFEIDIWAITAESSEGHFHIELGLLGIFSWFLNDTIVSLSRDGKELPQIYARSDIESLISNPSPIIELGGEPAFEYLRNYIEQFTKSNSIEPHADWNAIVYNGPLAFGQYGHGVDASNLYTGFQKTNMYYGKSLQVRFANGSNVEWFYSAGSTHDLLAEKMTSPENIYNIFIANPAIPSGVNTRSDEHIGRGRLEPVALDERQQQDSPRVKPLPSVPLFNYPRNPDVLEVNFGRGGIVSGYILKDDSVGVLSLPSYDKGIQGGTSALNYTDAVLEFIARAQENKVKKIVIDLSGNGGGSVFLGYTIFKLFFPSIEPSLLGRVRATPHINTIGSIITGVLQDGPQILPSKDFDEIYYGQGGTIGLSAYELLDVDGRDFETWSAFFGPHQNNGDSFTNGAKYNLSTLFIQHDLKFAVPGYGLDIVPSPQSELWAAEDIILLHDGICASTCATFSELMKTDAGVKSVAVGGIPQYGPMQGVSGTRGSRAIDFEDYAELIDLIRKLVDSLGNQAATILRRWGVSLDDIRALPLPMSSSPLHFSGGVNALDMIRVSSPDAPLQFTYQASDCRLFHTFETAHDIRVLWRTVAKVASGDMSACVPGSTKAPGASHNVTLLSDPGYSYNSTWERANSTEVPDRKGFNGNGSSATQLSVGLSGLLAVSLAFIFVFNWS
ncbi:unnamed protein product [Clonostachys rosea]|uniref:Tail specific protease domain-containing protein n=1 Tax=Bionectria ochroleuca TaxID=29856 RepID=A0ABY6U891_BIOOC|nr:unnamed protein product [Clonostachys rosea]